MRAIIGILLLPAVIGCRTAFTISEPQAVMIARQVCEVNEGWSDKATYNARREGRAWSVLVHRIAGEDEFGNPRFDPADTRIVLIDMGGKVIGYRRAPALGARAEEAPGVFDFAEYEAAAGTNDVDDAVPVDPLEGGE